MHGLETLILRNAGGLPARFTTLVMKKSAIRSTYPGGLGRFQRDYPRTLEEGDLIGLVFMSTGELWETVEVLRGQGYDMDAYGVLDASAGPIMSCPGVEYFTVDVSMLALDWRAWAFAPLWRARVN